MDKKSIELWKDYVEKANRSEPIAASWMMGHAIEHAKQRIEELQMELLRIERFGPEIHEEHQKERIHRRPKDIAESLETYEAEIKFLTYVKDKILHADMKKDAVAFANWMKKKHG